MQILTKVIGSSTYIAMVACPERRNEQMNPKIQKLRAEHKKNKDKISDLQAKNRELERRIRELEDVDIVGMVREQGYTVEQFAELLRQMRTTKGGFDLEEA